MPITLTTYPDEDLAIFECTGVFDYDEWIDLSRDYLHSQATFQINDIRRIDLTRVTPDLLRAVVLTLKRNTTTSMPVRGRTAFIIAEQFQAYALFNTFMRWVHTLELHRDFALFFATDKALEWFGMNPATTRINPQGAGALCRTNADSQ